MYNIFIKHLKEGMPLEKKIYIGTVLSYLHLKLMNGKKEGSLVTFQKMVNERIDFWEKVCPKTDRFLD